MPFDFQRAKQQLQAFDLITLFIQNMGWDRANQRLEIPINGERVQLNAIAQKRGMTAFEVAPLVDGRLPNYAERRKIEGQVRKSVHEHILIFSDGKTRQVWQWVRREPGRPTTGREFEVTKGQSGEALANHLKDMVFTLEEEEQIGIVDVTSRVRAAFDVERVTRRFYERFRDEHAGLLGFLQGIPDEEMQRWYVSVTMNRLMFVYFIQKKGFLNGDLDYLRNRLLESKFRAADRFYADFLCPLFFEGFARKETERPAEINHLLGKVPYLNGGIFQKHEIEKAHGRAIQIPDRAFDRVFDFFDQYRWHLDERPLRNDSEINPDVLGYIFEKYINQREMGAYYTKEDITGYISKSTVLPYLLDQARKDCAIAFSGEHAVWRLLQSDPERYIYDAVKKGCHLPLPAEIAAGIDDVAQRGNWNRAAAEELALPTETWREAVARRERFEGVRGKLAAGEVRAVDDLITYNLDIQQFTQDVVEESEGPELLRAFWKGLRGMRVLDPTCGSGAFLFAALNMLEPLYEACLERMQTFVNELDADGAPHRPEKYADFRKVLEDVGKHPNRRYFILKSIIVNNLYGVDIMEEAVEICKLRLFLKLIAQIEQADQIEPLPDIDFNIRAGNTLVGFTKYDDVVQALTTDANGQMFIPTLEISAQLSRIEEEASLASRAFERFQEQQLEQGFVKAEDKEALRERLEGLNLELNRALAKSYGVNADTLDFSKWLSSHKPFHWYVEFYAIMKQGGFNVIIGNPPYIAHSRILYRIQSEYYFSDIYAHIIEKSLYLNNVYGRIGMIVPLSLTFSSDYNALREIINYSGNSWYSSFDNIPASIFSGVSQRCTIWIAQPKTNINTVYVAPMYRWRSEFRPHLVNRIVYTKLSNLDILKNGIPKIGDIYQLKLLEKISKSKRRIIISPDASNIYKIGFSQAARNFISVFLENPPCLDASSMKPVPPSKIGYIKLTSNDDRYGLLTLLTCDVFFLYWLIRGDGFDVTTWVISDYVTSLGDIPNEDWKLMIGLGKTLHQRRNEALVFKKNAGKYVGNFNYKHLSLISRRADLLLLGSLGFSRFEAINLLNNLRRVLEINVQAGEKNIPSELKQRFADSDYDKSALENLLLQVDSRILSTFGFTKEELDFIINYDMKYHIEAEE